MSHIYILLIQLHTFTHIQGMVSLPRLFWDVRYAVPSPQSTTVPWNIPQEILRPTLLIIHNHVIRCNKTYINDYG
jgi:hypothetical protein